MNLKKFLNKNKIAISNMLIQILIYIIIYSQLIKDS